ncbi:MAG: hypothetical protein JWM70_1085 [Microbacteriaceae bacterium]|nr:hypothetical protein [Microbacteriaceae bacterium]
MSDTSEGASTPTEVSIRRAPKIPVFLVLGAVLGALATLVLTALQPADPAIGFPALFGYFCIFGVPFGAVVGGFVAILLDRRATRHARRLTAEHFSVEAPSEPDGPAQPDYVVVPDATLPDAAARPAHDAPQPGNR